MIQTRTQGIIHFEDLDPRIFEKMCLDLLVASKEYKDFKTYGVKGNDDGQDIRCRVVESNQTCFVQCKRWKTLCLSEMKAIVDRIVKDEANYKSQIILIIAACDISKDVQDAYEAYASELGFSEAKFWGKSILDSLITIQYPQIMERYIGCDEDREDKASRRIKKARDGRNLVDQELIDHPYCSDPKNFQSLLKEPADRFIRSEVLIRSIYDEVYPRANEDAELSTWFKSYPHDTYNDGILFRLHPWIYVSIYVNQYGEWSTTKKDENSLELKVDTIGKLPYYNIVDIIPDGDHYSDCPIMFCVFDEKKGPFEEIGYLYTNYETKRRVIFDKYNTSLQPYDLEKINEWMTKFANPAGVESQEVVSIDSELATFEAELHRQHLEKLENERKEELEARKSRLEWIYKVCERREISPDDILCYEQWHVNKDGVLVAKVSGNSNYDYIIREDGLNEDSSHYEKAYDAWCKHLLPKGFVENFVAFRKAFTLAWSRSKCTDHDDPDFIKHYHELDFERFIRLTPKR